MLLHAIPSVTIKCQSFQIVAKEIKDYLLRVDTRAKWYHKKRLPPTSKSCTFQSHKSVFFLLLFHKAGFLQASLLWRENWNVFCSLNRAASQGRRRGELHHITKTAVHRSLFHRRFVFTHRCFRQFIRRAFRQLPASQVRRKSRTAVSKSRSLFV